MLVVEEAVLRMSLVGNFPSDRVYSGLAMQNLVAESFPIVAGAADCIESGSYADGSEGEGCFVELD